MTGLKISYDELRRQVGRHLGFDRNPSNWDATESQDIADVIRGGQGHFYWPPAVGEGPSHRWSFLCERETLTLASGDYQYDLPSDFVRLCSPVTYSYNDGRGRVAGTGDAEMRSLLSSDARQGLPRYCSIRAKEQATPGYEILFFPVPDQALTVEFLYEKTPAYLEDANQYHLGPAAHSELLLSACLMEADKMFNGETIAPDGGLHAQRFFRQLAASVAIDRDSLNAEP